jgi:hypothetical protein
MSIPYSEYVFVVLGIRNALRMRHTVICGLSGSHHLIDGRILEKKIYWTQNVCFDFQYIYLKLF